MSVEIALGTPLADALNVVIQGKIADLGWAGAGNEGAAMAEYFLLMLVNGKTQQEIATEISGDLLGLGPDDDTAPAFSRWLFEQISTLNSQLNSAGAPAANGQNHNGSSRAMDMPQDEAMDGGFDAEMDSMTDAPASELNAYVSHGQLKRGRPKAMRAGGNMRGGREKRMMGQINRALDRTHESVLHRVHNQSGNARIQRNLPSGPRMGVGRQPRATNARVASVAQGLANMGGVPPGPGPIPMNGGVNGGMNGMGMPPMPGNFMQPDIYAMMEQQSRLLEQMQQQIMMQQQQGAGKHAGNGHGKSLFDRTSRPNQFRRGGAHHQHNGRHHSPQQQQQQQHQQQSSEATNAEATSQSEDVDMPQPKREPPNAEETICKFNLRCTNKECKFAHQSPAAPPGITVDVKDVCTFGAACKNRKCVGRHPSPATKVAHQSEQDCKFFPNCQNPHCTFRHPTTSKLPACRNGGECKVPNCQYTHLKTPCKFRPCTNRFCPFSHEEGQRGTFQDKVWVSDEAKGEHVSERKFVNESATEDLVLPGSAETNPEADIQDVIDGDARTSTANQPTTVRHVTRANRAIVSAQWLQNRPVMPSEQHLVLLCAMRGITALLLGRRGLSSSTAATRRIRCYATTTTTTNNPPQRSIAVLGGGLTGLTAAYYLTRYAPHAKITIYEASDRLGGWIDTEEVAVKTPEGKEGKVLFERGARTIASQNGQPKFDDLVFHDLVTHLGLKSELRSTDKKRDRVRRFIYYPDHLVDVTGPVLSPLTKPLATITSLVQFAVSLFREPLFRGALPSVLHMQKGHELVRQKSDRDLSIGDFFHTLFGRRELVDNVMSGMMHGIYGGDVWKLSTESSGMFSYNLDVLRTNLLRKSVRKPGEILIKLEDWELLWDMASRDAEVFQTAREAMGAGYVWFSGGFQTLTDGLVNNLKRNPNVTIKTGTPVRSVGYDHDSARVRITTSESDHRPIEYDKAVSTLVARTLAGLTDDKLPTLAQEQAVTIMVVNLWYPVPNLHSPYNNGFGYLMPQSLGFENNPECALGVLFDSDRDAIIGDDASDTVPGTKFTVMLGGHLWSDLPPEWLPSSEDAIRMAKSVVSRHLNIPEEVSDQAVASTKLCKECIPQQFTGHRQRMATAHQELLRNFQGKLAVAGTSYQPPGVLTSLRAGRDVAWQISGGWKRGSSSPGRADGRTMDEGAR
ncbi:hypothetical protein QBC46DRAFT_362335 [Diplogelasinospora grovesii]|uniref:protoporphyrinogen oxidase n=1 Tax=Diplogelasinospora grovesii TaxID=303347 RepID=A0AAN6NCV1_9PEZI|nr:hypothetical protein QBC46DRAFT_362335 [Diplogelasinospora grovesii]